MLTEYVLASSSWFDADWYKSQYPDVAASGLSAAQHYLKLGEVWGRNPGPHFNTRWYVATYPDVASAGISPLAHFITYGEQEGRMPAPLQAEEWEHRLWNKSATESRCLGALQQLLHNNPVNERSYASWALARWYAWREQWPQVATLLAGWNNRHPHTQPRGPAPLLLYIDALIKTSEWQTAELKIQSLRLQFPDYWDTYLAKANLLGAKQSSAPHQQPPWEQQQRLALINHIWQQAGLATVMLAEEQQAATLDNLTYAEPGAASRPPLAQPLVSVIIPVYNAGSRLATALQSLVQQSLVTQQPGSLEIIVVDDASTDNSMQIAEEFSRRFGFIHVLRQPLNEGAYAARNAGLARSQGQFITVHDSDDWSHPQKLELQLQGLLEHPHWMACNSHWVRCNSKLQFGRWRMEQGWIYRNTSSLMFRRRVFETLGYWDRVRIDADTEYYHRIRAAFGPQALGEVLPGIPLAFGRAVASSLSQAGPTHLCTQFAGIRYEYQQAAQRWHGQAKSPAALYLPSKPAARPFPAPLPILP